MGTFTAVLNLFKPAGTDLVDEAADLNTNWDKVDTYASGVNTDLGNLKNTWQTYTPTWTSSGTQPVLGNGTINGYYRINGKTADILILLVIGSTTTLGTGNYLLSLPPGLTLNTGPGVLNQLGEFRIKKNAGSGYSGLATLDSPDTVCRGFVTPAAAGGTDQQWGATAPAALVTSDRVSVHAASILLA